MIRCVAAAVMAMAAVSVHAESVRADAALEIVGGVGTTVITDVFERIEFGLSDLPPPVTWTMTGAALRGDLRRVRRTRFHREHKRHRDNRNRCHGCSPVPRAFSRAVQQSGPGPVQLE